MKKLALLILCVITVVALVTAWGGGGHKRLPPIVQPPPSNEVSGTLTDSYGNPLPDASLLVNGEDIGIKSDAEGNFTIPAGTLGANETFQLGGRRQGGLLSEREFILGEDWRLDWQLGESDPNGGTVNGTVINRETEELVPDAALA